MTAPTGGGGGATPWKAKWAAIIIAALAVSTAPAAVGGFAAAFFHGLGTIGCHLSPSSCTPEGTPQLNPMKSVETRAVGPAEP